MQELVSAVVFMLRMMPSSFDSGFRTVCHAMNEVKVGLGEICYPFPSAPSQSPSDFLKTSPIPSVSALLCLPPFHCMLTSRRKRKAPKKIVSIPTRDGELVGKTRSA